MNKAKFLRLLTLDMSKIVVYEYWYLLKQNMERSLNCITWI